MEGLGNDKWRSLNLIHSEIWHKPTKQKQQNIDFHSDSQMWPCVKIIRTAYKSPGPGAPLPTFWIQISRDVAQKLYFEIIFPGDSWAASLALVHEMEFGNHCFTNKWIPEKLFVHGDFISGVICSKYYTSVIFPGNHQQISFPRVLQ